MCLAEVNLLQAAIIGPYLIYLAGNPNPDTLRVIGFLTIFYNIYQLQVKGYFRTKED